MSEQRFKVEVYHQNNVFKSAYFDSREEAERAARDALAGDEKVREAKVLDHGGKVLETFGREG